jgi:hypothetical protein
MRATITHDARRRCIITCCSSLCAPSEPATNEQRRTGLRGLGSRVREPRELLCRRGNLPRAGLCQAAAAWLRRERTPKPPRAPSSKSTEAGSGIAGPFPTAHQYDATCRVSAGPNALEICPYPAACLPYYLRSSFEAEWRIARRRESRRARAAPGTFRSEHLQCRHLLAQRLFSRSVRVPASGRA